MSCVGPHPPPHSTPLSTPPSAQAHHAHLNPTGIASDTARLSFALCCDAEQHCFCSPSAVPVQPASPVSTGGIRIRLTMRDASQMHLKGASQILTMGRQACPHSMAACTAACACHGLRLPALPSNTLISPPASQSVSQLSASEPHGVVGKSRTSGLHRSLQVRGGGRPSKMLP